MTRRWEPLRELEAVQNEMRRVLGQLGGSSPGQEGERDVWLPPLDVSESEEEIRLVLDLPGVAQEEIAVEVDEGTLTVSGTRARERREGERFYRAERRVGSFGRSVPLPAGIDEGAIQADVRDGVLEIRIPKPRQPEPRRIRIGGSESEPG